MKILSLETATYFGGVAYLAPDAAQSAGPFPPRGASKEILAAADQLLRTHHCPPSELDLVAVSTGPGLFTGLRVGLAIAKTMVWAQGPEAHTRLVEISTLEAVANLLLDIPEATLQDGDLATSVTDARRGEVYAALFEVRATKGINDPDSAQEAHSLHRLGDDLVVRPEQIAERLFPTEKSPDAPGATLWFIGDGMKRYPEIIPPALAERAKVVSHESANLPLRVAKLAHQKYKEGHTSAPDQAQPHYVRRPDARPPAVASYLADKKE